MSFFSSINKLFANPDPNPALSAFSAAANASQTACLEIGFYTSSADDLSTMAELDAHTAVMNGVTGALDNLTDAFLALTPREHLPSADSFYKLTVEAYVIYVDGYKTAAGNAHTHALSDSLQSAKDEFEVLRREWALENATPDKAVMAAADLAVFRRKAVSKAKSETFLQKARAAEAMAESLTAKADAILKSLK